MSAPHEQGALDASLSDPMTQPQEQGASAARTAGEAACEAWRQEKPRHFLNDQARQKWERIADAVGAALSEAAKDVLAERQRQVAAEGWSPEHDDTHGRGEMAQAAACYALPQAQRHCLDARDSRPILTHLWPWDQAWWKPGDRRRELVKAGALILAEIERLDRAAHPAGQSTGLEAEAERLTCENCAGQKHTDMGTTLCPVCGGTGRQPTPAPDSTRTGPVGTEALARAVEALNGSQLWLDNNHPWRVMLKRGRFNAAVAEAHPESAPGDGEWSDGASICAIVNEAIKLTAALAARPAAPEAQGAWRERAATEIDAIGHQWRLEGDANGQAYAKTLSSIIRAEAFTPPSSGQEGWAMGVYAVLIVLGQTVASIGPWPADLANCQSNIPASNADLDATFADPAKVAKLREAWPGVERHQVEWTCIESATKPVIKNPVKP